MLDAASTLTQNRGSLPAQDEEGHTPIYYKLACGASAGLVSQTVSYPLDTVRRRMTLQVLSQGSH